MQTAKGAGPFDVNNTSSTWQFADPEVTDTMSMVDGLVDGLMRGISQTEPPPEEAVAATSRKLSSGALAIRVKICGCVVDVVETASRSVNLFWAMSNSPM